MFDIAIYVINIFKDTIKLGNLLHYWVLKLVWIVQVYL